MSITPLPQTTSNRFQNIHLDTLSDLEKSTLVDLAIAVLAPNIGEPITSPEATRQYLQLHYAGYKNEVFGCLFLDTRHRLIVEEKLFFGTINGSSTHPRVVVQKCMEHNAAAVIFFHYVPRNIMKIMCPDSLCGVLA